VLSGRFPVTWVPLLSSILSVVTIGLCYYLAVNAGHVEPFPDTDITHCGKEAPERYVFRIGIVSSSVIMVYGYILMRQWIQGQEALNDGHTPRPKCCITLEDIASLLGVIGSLCLVVSASVIEAEDTPWDIHIIFAMLFFGLSAAAQVIVTFKLCLLYNEYSAHSLTSFGSLALKVASNGCMGVFLLLYISADFLKQHGYMSPVGATEMKNAMEWILVGTIVFYGLTFALDTKGKAYQTLMILPHHSDRSEQTSVVLPLIDIGLVEDGM